MPDPKSQKVALRIEQDTPCPDCGYNLRGLRLDGRCPECGRPTIDTFARPLRASTGVLAELMIRRSAKLLLALLAWWSAYRWVAWYLSPALGQIVLLAATLLAGLGLLVGLGDAARLRRQTAMRHGGTIKPLRDAALLWLVLCALAAAFGFVLLAMAWLPALGATTLLMTLVSLAACAAAAGAHAMACHAAVSVLKRAALPAPVTLVSVAGAAEAVLVAVVLAPPLGPAIPVTAARTAVALAALATWLVASYLVIGKLQEAQGSVVSIGRASRR